MSKPLETLRKITECTFEPTYYEITIPDKGFYKISYELKVITKATPISIHYESPLNLEISKRIIAIVTKGIKSPQPSKKVNDEPRAAAVSPLSIPVNDGS